MKYVLVTIPGSADQPADELNGKTPFEVAKVPNLNYFARQGKVGVVRILPGRGEPSSDVSFLSLLGYDVTKNYTGRGPLEAASLELELTEDEIPFRMNFVTESSGRLADATAGGLSSKESLALVGHLNKKLSNDFVRFFPGESYRHIAVLKDSHGFEGLSAKTQDPETFIGERIENHFPKGAGEELLRKLMYDARSLLVKHEINQVRVDLMENPANMIWLWGQGKKPSLASFMSTYGMTGAVVSRMEYVRGAARLSGLSIVDLPAETGDPETDLSRQGKAVLAALKNQDFVCCHLENCDAAARTGDFKAKVSALEAIDFFCLSWLRERFEKDSEIRVLVTPSHATPWKLMRHVKDPVPFAVAGGGVIADEVQAFSELAARSTDLNVASGKDLMMSFLKG